MFLDFYYYLCYNTIIKYRNYFEAAMKKNKSKRKIFKSWWFWCIAIGIFLLVGNFIYAIFGNDCKQSNILTAISGWVSGLSTLLVGIIAFKQNSYYTFVAKKAEIVDKIDEERRLFTIEHLAFTESHDLNNTLREPMTGRVKNLVYMEKLHDKLCRYYAVVKTCLFIPEHLKSLLDSLAELIQKSAEFSLKGANDQDSLEDLTNFVLYFIQWKSNTNKIIKDCMEEYGQKVLQINNSKNLSQLLHIYTDIIAQSEKALVGEPTENK